MQIPKQTPQEILAALMGGNCRYCKAPVNDKQTATLTYSYWQGDPFICHKACKDAGIKREAYECQCIDADCNDCRHYRRGKLAPQQISLTKTTDGRIVEIIYNPNIIIGGHCLKFDRKTNAYPNKWSGLECFEHRRAAKETVTTDQ